MTIRTYPKRCGNCGQEAMELGTVPYATTIEHDGRAYRVEVPALTVPRCSHCQAISIDDEADRQISAAFRREARLLASTLTGPANKAPALVSVPPGSPRRLVCSIETARCRESNPLLVLL